MKNFYKQTGFSIFSRFLLAVVLVVGVAESGWGQYDGTGTFQQITSLDDLESGMYYVFYGINGTYNGAMTNTISSGRLGNTAVTITGAGIIDPSKSIVWLVEGNAEDGYTVYNEDAEVYSEITANSTSGFALNSSSSHTYAVSVDSDKFTFASNHTSGGNRAISIYQSDWRPYTNPNTLHLYKLSETEDPLLSAVPTSVSDLDYALNEGPSDPQLLTITGINLDGNNVTVTASANFEVSETEIGGYESTITINAFDGNETYIWVQLIDGLGLGSYSGTISISGGGADEVTVSLAGNVWPDYDYTETFEHFPVTASSYATDEVTGFLGVAGNTWYYVNARGDIIIDDETVTLQNNTAAKLYSTINGGVTDFSFDYMQAFSTNVHLQVYVNGSLAATVTSDGEQNIVKNSGNISLVDKDGTFTIEFIQGTSPGGGQVAIDNFSWKQGESVPVDNPVFDPSADTYFEDQTVFVSNFSDYDPGVTVYYTTNGDDPDDQSTEYNDNDGIELLDGNGPITLKAIAIDNGIESGITTAVYIFPENVPNIAAFRGGDNGTLYRITGEVVVLHRDGFRNRHFVRDESGSLTIWDDNTPNSISTLYNVGDGVTGFIGVKAMKNNEALVVLEAAADPGAASGNNLDVMPITVTIANLTLLHTGNLVKIENAEFEDTGTFATGQNYAISDDSKKATINFRTDFYDADYINNDIPEGTLNLTAIVGGFGINPQVTARSLGDFEDVVIDDPVLNADPTTLSNLDYIEGDGPSDPQSFELTGINLDGTDVTITAPDDFKISEDVAKNFSATITLAAYDGTAQTIWVRLDENLPVDTYDGNVTITGGGVDVGDEPTVAVSGDVMEPLVTEVPFYTNFDVDGNWVTGSGYAGGAEYHDAGWSFVGVETLRNSTQADAYDGSDYYFQNRGDFTITNEGSITGMTGFSIYIRNWGISTDRSIKISIDGENNFEEIGVINSDWFDNDDDYFDFSYYFTSAQDINNKDFNVIIEGGNSNTTRMRIGGFEAFDDFNFAYNENTNTFYQTLQDAVDAASEGDRIVFEGIYYTVDTNTGPGVTLAPGSSPGCAIFTTTFTLTASDDLEIEIDGLTPCTEHDQIQVGTLATLGDANLDVILGFAPSVGDEFVIMTYGTIDGEFSQGSSVTAGFGGQVFTFSIDYTTDDSVTLEVTGVEDPVAIPIAPWTILLSVGLMLIFLTFRFRNIIA